MKKLPNIPPLEVVSDFESDDLHELYRCGGIPEFMLEEHYIGFGAERLRRSWSKSSFSDCRCGVIHVVQSGPLQPLRPGASRSSDRSPSREIATCGAFSSSGRSLCCGAPRRIPDRAPAWRRAVLETIVLGWTPQRDSTHADSIGPASLPPLKPEGFSSPSTR
jgi:hypothetical protein